MFAGLLQADKFKLSPVGTSKNVFFASGNYRIGWFKPM
jgi:hypothetical protein